MKIILLSGGSGKRLWPMSNDGRPKQFLKVLKDAGGTSISMLQRVWSQMGQVGLCDHAFVCAPQMQRSIIESQISNAPFIAEPDRRDTFPAIALSVLYLRDVEGCSEDEVVTVLPVDPYVHLSYFETVKTLGAILEASNLDMMLMGVKPSSPTSKYGYICTAPGSRQQPWRFVDCFVEKPATQRAQALIDEGALWNCGVFSFRIGFIARALEEMGYPSTFERLRRSYTLLPKRSFDYEVVENTHKIAVVEYAGSWEDLGTWGALSTKIDHPFEGLGTASQCENTHVINELGIPVVAMGLRDMMVVSTPEGILVADKETAASLKEIVSEGRTGDMLEDKAWGHCRVLDYQKHQDAYEVLTQSIHLNPGKNFVYHRHVQRSETWIVVDGTGRAIIDSKVFDVCVGDVIRVQAGEWHTLRSETGLSLIEIQQGPPMTEVDVMYGHADWGDIVMHSAPVSV